MKLEVLMSTMNQTDFQIINRANITSDAIIINQADLYSYKEFKKDKNVYRMYTSMERGIGKSRSKALMYSDADICLLADDDVKYNDDYEKIILNEFARNKSADIIIFDMNILESYGYRTYRNKKRRINKLNFMKHGGPKIAFRRSKVIRKNIYFSLLFGGGATYGSGEDSLFLKECLDAGLKIYETDQMIGEIDNRGSSWFTGYNKEYLLDTGALFKAMFPQTWSIMCAQFVIRHHKKFPNKSRSEMIRLMIKGAKDYW